MPRIKFIWNEEQETYLATLKLEDNIARIYFSRNFGSIKKEKYLGWIWNVGLAIGKKKEIKNWYFSSAPTSLSNLPTFNKYGVAVLVWAKKAIEQFIEENSYHSFAIAIGAEDNKRWKAYKKGLKKLSFKPATVKYGYNYDFKYDYIGDNNFYYCKELVYIFKK